MFYTGADVNGVEYREEPCRSALNRVRGMPFEWSLNPYMGCAHQCTFCYVRAFEKRADRPSDSRYGRSIRVKVNVADVLRSELARPSWQGGGVAIGAATDPPKPPCSSTTILKPAVDSCLAMMPPAAPEPMMTKSTSVDGVNWTMAFISSAA